MLSHHNVSSLCLMAMLLPFWPNVLMAEVGPKEQCDGAAIIWPTEDHYGSIYISRDLRDGSFPRLGYLPSGTVVTLDEPYADSKDGFKKQHCGFRFRDAIVGQIDRRHITKLTGTLRSANLNDSDAVIIAPSNPNSEKSLFLHEGKDSDSKVIKQVSRGDRIIILASLRDLRDTSDTIKVRYTDDILSRSPEFAEAYVRREDNRTFGYDGTFRTFSPFVPSESTSSEQDRNSWFGSRR